MQAAIDDARASIITDGHGSQFGWDSTGAYVHAMAGWTYRGEVRNSTMNGTGTMTYPNGTKYEGGWKDGKQHGQGTYTWPDGSK